MKNTMQTVNAAEKSIKNTDSKKHGFKEVILESLPYIIFTTILVILMKFVIIHTVVPSGSMESTIQISDHLIGVRSGLAYNDSLPERGDIIIFKYPDDESQLFVKRVIGLPGETVEIKYDGLYINGEKLEEDYILETMYVYEEESYVVPEGEYFVLGDNRNNSLDSRYWEDAYVEKDQIIAKVWARISLVDKCIAKLK